MLPIRLTLRGTVLLVGGVVALLAAGRYELDALRPVSGLLLGLVVLGVTAALLVPRRLGIERQATSRVLDHGASTTARVRLSNRSRVQAHDLTWRAPLPDGLGGVQSGTVARLDPRWATASSVEVDVRLSGVARGRHPLGILVVEVRDPFGVVVRRRRYSDDVTMVVLPRRVRLERAAVLRGMGADRDSRRTAGRRGETEDDVVPREYQPGDAPKRIDWRSTARRGELMVRQDAPATADRVAVAVDPGTSAGPTEWALTAAASVMSHLVERGYAVTTVVPGHESRTVVGGQEALRPVLVDLAELTHDDREDVLADHDTRSVVVVLGVVSVQRAQEWASVLHQTPRVAGLVAAESGEAAIGLLRSAGWRVVAWDEVDDVGTRWKELGSASGSGGDRAAG
ncbi:DUF58 domain-containing protein [Aeromicrobium alkaliterrae]|uniref:DUF58 domain-containing protein n=1 Tax=Aeromicrobium alkaliterrae TaxID=302168 RepID=A0ABN2JH44_9ACTN